MDTIQERDELLKLLNTYSNTIPNANTKRAYIRHNENMLLWLTKPLDSDVLLEYKGELLKAKLSKQTVNQSINAINWFCKLLNTIKGYRLIKLDTIALNRKHAKRPLTDDIVGFIQYEIEQRICNTRLEKYIRNRDLSIFHCLRHGLRRSEICGVLMGDIYPMREGGYKILIRGKGNDKERWLICSPSLNTAIGQSFDLETDMKTDWLNDRQWLLNRSLKPLTTDGLYHIVKSWFNASPHKWRHELVSGLLDKGVDLLTIAKVTGHSSIETLKHYDDRVDNDLIEVSKLIG